MPEARRAVIDATKLRDYLLSPAHPVGRFKAVYFASLGFTQENWQQLRSELQSMVVAEDLSRASSTVHGQKFEVPGRLVGPGGRIGQVVTVWIILTGEDAPRFVTAYPGVVS